MTGRFFLSQDNSCHWYLVPAQCRDEWNAWADLPEDDEAGWEPPAFARRLNGSPRMITFTDPVES
jgi:hypothetical protein